MPEVAKVFTYCPEVKVRILVLKKKTNKKTPVLIYVFTQVKIRKYRFCNVLK